MRGSGGGGDTGMNIRLDQARLAALREDLARLAELIRNEQKTGRATNELFRLADEFGVYAETLQALLDYYDSMNCGGGGDVA